MITRTSLKNKFRTRPRMPHGRVLDVMFTCACDYRSQVTHNYLQRALLLVFIISSRGARRLPGPPRFCFLSFDIDFNKNVRKERKYINEYNVQKKVYIYIYIYIYMCKKYWFSLIFVVCTFWYYVFCLGIYFNTDVLKFSQEDNDVYITSLPRHWY